MLDEVNAFFAQIFTFFNKKILNNQLIFISFFQDALSLHFSNCDILFSLSLDAHVAPFLDTM
jgi:hypothetical protein